MIDVAASIAALEAERAKLDAAIAALRALQNGGAPAAAAVPLPIPARRRPAATPQEHYGKVTPEQWQQALTWWTAGDSAVEIGKRLGITDASVFYQAQQHKWPKRQRAIKPTQAAQAPAPTVTQLEPRRRCPHCAGMTATDPCSWCKKALAA